MTRARLLSVLALAAFWAGVSAAPAAGGGCRDFSDGWVIPPERLEVVLAPIGSAGTGRDAWICAGQARLYGMPELPLRALAAGWRDAGWAAAVSWQRLGGALLREDRLRCRLLRLAGGRAGRTGDTAVGLTAGWDALRLEGGTSERRAALALEVRLVGPGGTRVAGSLPLSPPPSWYGGTGLRRWWSLAGGGDGGAWAVALDRDGRGAPIVEAEAALRVASGAALGLRWEPATGSLGLTTAWLWRGSRLRSSHLAHPELGVTHRWSVTLGRAPEAAP